jgi:FkbM family methyltransferase
MKALLKNIAYLLLPEPILRRLKNAHYSRTFKTFSIELIPEYTIMSQLIPIGSTVLDIGANIGLLSKCFSFLVGPGGRVYSLEPVPQTYDILCSNITLLTFNNVVSMNYAVSDTETTAIMVIPTYQSRHGIDIQGNVYEGMGDNFYEAKIIHENEREAASKHVTVETKKIDSLFADYPGNISFIKCDVEGHELACILGSLKVIRRNKPALSIEVMGDRNEADSSANRLFKILRNEGYGSFYLNKGVLRPLDAKSNEINFFFLLPRHIAQLNSVIID